MKVDLDGKRALITGASGGIGFEVAKGLLSLGAEVLITGRDEKKLTLAADYLRKDT
ncbi:MAG: SDR family NAD(P)-dependent oxidoreductase, partial [Pseudomonadota bacterium]